MPKAKGKGGKNRRRGKNDAEGDKRELIFKEDGQEYAQVVKMLGNGRIEAKCQDGETRLGQIRGQMRKKVWIVAGDIILLSLRDFQDDRADVIHKYTADEARNLKTYGELKSDFTINEAADGGDGGSSDEEGGGVEFEEADIDDICGCLKFRLMVVLTGLAESIPTTIHCPGTHAGEVELDFVELAPLATGAVSSSDTYPTLETGQALYTTMKHLTAAIWE